MSICVQTGFLLLHTTQGSKCCKQDLHGRLVTRLTIEERMMQQTKKKMVLEHLVVHKMNSAADLKQVNLSFHLHSLHSTMQQQACIQK